MADIVVPKLNVNDTSYTLLEWLVPDGARVVAGDPVAVVETSKAAEELACEEDGYLRILTPTGGECGAGQVIARVSGRDQPDEPGVPAPPASSTVEGLGGVLVTAPARVLAAEHGLDPAALAALGRRVVRREDVAALLRGDGAGGDAAPAGPDQPGVRTLSRAQRAVAATVVESHRQVPAAFVAVKVRVAAALALARTLRRRHQCLIGLPELLVKAVAAQLDSHPLCFASLVDGATVRLAEAAHVGVTIDVGDGLRVPVVHHTARLSWRELGTTVMGFRVTAMQSAFRPAQLAGGTITVALQTDEDVTFAVPLVSPGQVCAVSLPATQTVLVLGPDGAVAAEQVVQLGLAYDHRVINGSDAVAFLLAVKHLLGSPEELSALGNGGSDDESG